MIKIICAHDQNRVIGDKGKMPWHFPEDLQHFKTITLNHPVIMGRKTYESIGKALPHRTNVILTHDRSYDAEGCITITSLEEIQKLAKDQDLFIIGGQTLFEQMLPYADELYLTEIKAEFDGDTFFPEFNHEHYKRIVLKSTDKTYPADFILYRRKDH